MKVFGPLYVDKLRYYHRDFFPVVEVGHTQETEFPYRIGKALVFRVPFTHPGYVVGLWVDRHDVEPEDDDKIDDILRAALRERSIGKYTVDEVIDV